MAEYDDVAARGFDGGADGGAPAVDQAAPLPLYHQVYLALRQRIASGALPRDSLLPSEDRLCRHYGVSRITMRRALGTLRDDGYIERRRGQGSRVVYAPQAVTVDADFANIVDSLKRMGRTSRSLVLAFGYGPAPADVAENLGLEADAIVQIADRVRLVDEKPFSHLRTHVPARLGRHYGRGDLERTPIIELLERAGAIADSASQMLSAALARGDVAAALDMPQGSALLSMQRTVYDPKGRGIENLMAHYNPELFSFHLALSRDRGGARQWQPAESGKSAP